MLNLQSHFLTDNRAASDEDTYIKVLEHQLGMAS